MAFRGTYRAQLLVISASGSLSQDLGATHAYTWHVAPACGGSCVRATSTSHAAFTLTYNDGEFEGTGGGISHCLTQSGKATGAGFQTTLKITLLPATSATPVTALAGIEMLTVSSGCSGNTGPGTEVIQYALTRTGALRRSGRSVQVERGPLGVMASRTRPSASSSAANWSSPGTARPCFSRMARKRASSARMSSRISTVPDSAT